MKKNLQNIDPKIFNLIQQEENRQATTINLIASENYTHPAVLEAMGSVLTDKYAEGYPGKRYYAGCEFVDQVELLAQERCKKLFNMDHANVQPHAGSQANLAAYFSILEPGDTIMGMSLLEGGHLTHGHKVNFSGKIFNSVQYGVCKETGLLDYKEIERIAEQHKPKLIIAGASAYSRTIDFAQFAHIAKNVGAYLLTDIAHIAGLVAAGLHPSPSQFADFVTSTTHKTLRGPRGGLILCKNEFAANVDRWVMPGSQGGPFMHSIAAKAVCFGLALQPEFKDYQQQVINNAKTMAKKFKELNYTIVSGGTDNHLFIIDLRNKNMTGKDAEETLDSIGITLTRSCIPYDTEKPWITSGVRIGTPAITSAGAQEENCIAIVELINDALKNRENSLKLKSIKQAVLELKQQILFNTQSYQSQNYKEYCL